jgi:hypothetical protein
LRLKFRGTGGGGGGQTSTWDAAGSATACSTACFTFTTTNVANDTATATGSQNGTVVTVSPFPVNTTGKWYWELKIVAIASSGSPSLQLGIGTGNVNGYISQTGYNMGMKPDGSFIASGATGYTPPATQTSPVIAWPAGTIVGVYQDLTNSRIWWTTDNVNFYGAGATTVNTATDVANHIGGWNATIDNRARYPAIGTYYGTNKVQLLAGTNITRGGSMVSGFTVIP